MGGSVGGGTDVLNGPGLKDGGGRENPGGGFEKSISSGALF